MKISIVIPVYNSQETITRCLDSIKNQDFLDYEIVIINDGSTDETDKTIKEYINSNQDLKIIYRVTKNKGPAEARNLGLSLSNGEYIWFIDSDDEIEEQSLDIIVDTINKSNADILRFSFRKIVDGVPQRAVHKLREDIYDEVKLDGFVYESLSNAWMISMTCWQHLYKRDLIKDIKFIADKKPYEDMLFNCFVYPLSSNIQVITDMLYKYYIRSESISHVKQKSLYKVVGSYIDIKRHYIKNNCWEKYKNAIISAYGDFSMLGGGRKKAGALFAEFNYYDDFYLALSDIKELVSSDNFKELINDALNRNLPKDLEALYKCLEDNNPVDVYKYLISDSGTNRQKEEISDDDLVVFKINLEIVEIEDKIVAIPVASNTNSFIINLTKESATVLKYLLETRKISRTLQLLCDDYKNEDINEIKENLLDFISELRSQGIIK